MKKQILLLTICAGVAGAALMSNGAGAGTSAGNRTGSRGTTANCSGGGCHGGTGGTATITVDSVGGVPVTQYVPGMTYTITVTGSHATNTKFGFQFATVSGATAAAETHVGTYGSVPSGTVQRKTVGSSSDTVRVIEHSSIITGPLSKSFTWTAPSAGVGTVKMYLTVNCMDGVSGANSGDVSTNITKSLTQKPTTAVRTIESIAAILAFPNPVSGNDLHLQLGSGYERYSVNVFDVTGRSVYSSEVAPTVSGTATLNTSNWVPGLYKVVVSNENTNEVISVVKQ